MADGLTGGHSESLHSFQTREHLVEASRGLFR